MSHNGVDCLMFDFVIGGDNFCSVAVDDVTDDVIDGSETMP